MRSHAKASLAGSKPSQGSALGRIFRGAFATRGASLTADGSGAPSPGHRLALPVAFLVILLTLALGAGTASAANGVRSYFGGTGVTGGNFTEANGGPGGIAVNQEGTGGATAGDSYVVDRGNNRVQQFTAAGAFVRAFGFNVGGPGVHVCTVAASCLAGSASAEAAGMSNPQGIAIDQVNGNVYVTDQNNRRVDVFSATGVFQGAFGWGVDTGAAAFQFCTTVSTCQAPAAAGSSAGQFGTTLGYPAVAPAGSPNAGHVYIADKASRRVDQFEPTITVGEVTGMTFVRAWGWGVDTGASEFEKCTTASTCVAPNTSSPTSNPGQFASGQPQALAVDSNGNVYAAESSGNNRAQKFDSAGDPVAFGAAELTGSPGPQDIAVDKTTNRVYAIKEPTGAGERRVLEFNAGGAFIATHASGTTITSANGLAHIQGTSNFYISTNQQFEFRGVFFLATKVAPTASVEAPSPLTSSAATIKGKVNPKGFSTNYFFEFSRNNGSTWERVPPPPPTNGVNVGSGEVDVPVSQSVTGLIGGSSYRYKIVATKPFGAGTVTTAAHIFSAPASAPTVPATFTSAVTYTTAVLNAEINPQNQATEYHFEYGTEDCDLNPCASVPVPDAGIGSGNTSVDVANELTGLQPGSTYHFRVVATNGTGTTEGPDTAFNTYEVVTANPNCPNQQFRIGTSAALPDCRAFEMVSPVEKNGQDIYTTKEEFDAGFGEPPSPNQSSLDGNGVAYTSVRAFGDQAGAVLHSEWLGSRTASGWISKGINPPSTGGVPQLQLEIEYMAFSPDLSTGWVKPASGTPLAPGATSGHINLYRRDNTTGTYTTVSAAPANETNGWFIDYGGSSEDGSIAVFGVNDKLTPEARPGLNDYSKRQYYVWHDGELHVVGVLPNGEVFPGQTQVGKRSGPFGANEGGSNNVANAISDDGSRIFWTAIEANSTGPIYVREHAEQGIVAGECVDPSKACTIPVSGSVAPGPAQYWTASADGAKVLFSPGLATGSLPLYLFDVDSETPTQIAASSRGVVGASEDLSQIYFASTEALAGGATAGEPNLYHYDEGAISFIGPLSIQDTNPLDGGQKPSVTAPYPVMNAAKVTSDGRHLVFAANSTELAAQVGYDNLDADNGEPSYEVYRYEAGGELICVSCNPSGARPDAERVGVGASIYMTAAWLLPHQLQVYSRRYVSDDGNRVYFNAFDALLPEDTNGKQDVYQWEADGSGDCEKPGGCLSLISSGQGAEDSTFLDASASGNDVFIRTESSLLPQDPASWDVYDVRVSGGFPQPFGTPGCEGETCQTPPDAPNDPTPASSAFEGAGNVKEAAAKPRRCPKGKRKVRRNGKVRCASKRKSRANYDRRAAR